MPNRMPGAGVFGRRAAQAALVFGFAIGVVGVRVTVSGIGELRAARAIESEGRVADAILHYRRAARWHAPGAPWVSRSLDALERIGRAASDRDDRATALAAYRAMRGAILATRSLYTPFPGRLARANDRIAALMAEEPPAPADAQKNVDARRRMHAALLARDESPSVGWSLVMLLGFAAWMGGSVGFIRHAIGDDDRLVGRPALVWTACALGGFLIWMLALGLA